jgi:hypothetical protein
MTKKSSSKYINSKQSNDFGMFHVFYCTEGISPKEKIKKFKFYPLFL